MRLFDNGQVVKVTWIHMKVVIFESSVGKKTNCMV